MPELPETRVEGEPLPPTATDIEIRIKLAELEIKQAEAAKIRASTGGAQINWAVFGPLLVTVTVALIGMFSSIYVASVNGLNTNELESSKARTNLIIEAVKTGAQDRKFALDNIKFFLRTGLLTDPDGRIARAVEEGDIPIFDLGGFKLKFAENKRPANYLSSVVQGLSSAELMRLMTVDATHPYCFFEGPTQAMRDDERLINILRKKGLLSVKENLEALKSLRATLRNRRARGETIGIGEPRNCYQADLTEAGYNIKTVILKFLEQEFDKARKQDLSANTRTIKLKAYCLGHLAHGTPLSDRLDLAAVPLRGDLIALALDHGLAQ